MHVYAVFANDAGISNYHPVISVIVFANPLITDMVQEIKV